MSVDVEFFAWSREKERKRDAWVRVKERESVDNL